MRDDKEIEKALSRYATIAPVTKEWPNQLCGRSQVRAVHSRQHRQTKKDLPDRIHR